jgi:Rad52/22 family double-strand break repair protein
MAASKDQVALLAEPTPKADIKQRQAYDKGQPTGKMLDYIDARFVQDRLDRTVGPSNWQSRFEDSAIGGVRCGIGILIEQVDHDGTFIEPEWVWKWDVGDESSFEPTKGAHSDALKRAAVQWGIARDLYDTRAEESAPRPRQPARQVMAQEPQPQPVVQLPPPPYATFSPEGEPPPPSEFPCMTLSEPRWVCPEHHQVRVQPGGVSRTKLDERGQPLTYDAFYVCPVAGCQQRPPRGVRPPAA